MNVKARIATNVLALLLTKTDNQKEAAEAMGVSPQWLTDLTKERNASFDKLDTLAEYFQCDIAFLLFPPEIVLRDLARQTSRDTTRLLPHRGGKHVQNPSSAEEAPTEDDILDAVDALVILLERFRLSRRGSEDTQPEEPERRQRPRYPRQQARK